MEIPKTDPKLVERLKKLHTDSLWGALMRRGYTNQFIAGLQVIRPDLKMVGRALTLRHLPYRPDLLKKHTGSETTRYPATIIEMIEPGDILVFDILGFTGGGAFGDQMMARVVARGGAGMVVDGAMRDMDILRTMDIPLYVKAAHAGTTTREYPAVDLNVPVQCCGVTVVPGDILVGDTQGVIVIPPELAPEIVGDCEDLEDREAFYFKRILEGNLTVWESHPPSEALKAEYEEWKKRQKVLAGR